VSLGWEFESPQGELCLSEGIKYRGKYAALSHILGEKEPN